ncbi:MAG TPA: S-layer homology domain-containing protein [Negativicutes bacterium]|nr:S-layer homology domain-containing protein [Negativicutes bacterium]
MRSLKRATAFLMTLVFLLTSAGFAQIVEAATEEDSLEVKNEFVRYVVDSATGRFGISTVEGAPRRAADQEASLLYKGEEPDTSFTTFRIDGKDYIFGNDYGFLGIQGGMSKSPATQGGVNTTTWRMGDIEVRQQLTLVADSTNPDVGNVKVTYTLVNNGKTARNIGSRILFDTMLGANDGSPLIIPGIDKPVEYELSLEGDKVPSFWQSADTDISPDVVSYGLLSGWDNEAPDRMTAAHWSGIGSTKWDYQADSTVKFASVFNKYNESDSAVALYWDPETLGAGETRVYETFYGLGVFKSADGNTFLTEMTGPDSLELKADKTGYTQEEFELSLALDNSLPVSVAMTDVKATLELAGGLVLAEGQSKDINLGLIERDSRAEFTWRVKGEISEYYRIAQATVYLSSESLKEALAYSKYIILPGTSGKLPQIQYTGITPKNLYYQDTRKSFTINGTGFEVLKDRSKWELKLIKSGASGNVTYTISHKNINLIGDKGIQVLLPELSEAGTYTVKLEHDTFPGCTLTDALNISTDEAYKNLRYGILTVTHETGELYKLSTYESEEQLEKRSSTEADKTLLVIRGDVRQKENGKYEIYASSDTPVEINGILLYRSDVPITATESNGSVSIAGNGGLSVSGSVTFWKWGFEVSLDKGSKYSLQPSEEDGINKVEIEMTDAVGSLQNMLAGFNLVFNNAYFYKDDAGYSLIFGGSMFLSLGAKKGSGAATGGAGSSEADDEDDPLKIEANLEKVAMGQKADKSIGLKGIAAEAVVGFPKNYFPAPMDIGAEASLRVDTFSDPGEVSMKLDVDIKVVKVKGELEFVLIPYPIPDKVYFYLGSDAGVDIIPPIPVATLLGAGGGIDNIYNLVNLDASAPPFTVMLTASVEIGKILKMQNVTLSVSWQHAEITGDIGIKNYNIIKDATVRFRWYNPFGFHVSARLEAFDCIEGKILINIYENDFLGMASVRLYVPTKVPVIGGMTIAGAEAGVDMEKLWAELEILSITMGVKYVYGEKAPDFYIGEGDTGPGDRVARLSGTEGLCVMNYKDKETGEEGHIIYGTNFKLMGSSETDKAYAYKGRYMAAAGDDEHFIKMSLPIVTALADNSYRINVQSPEAALFELQYEGTKPGVKVYRPDGKEYALVENDMAGNMRYQTIPAADSDSGKEEKKIWITAVGPQLGAWRVVSDRPLTAAKLYDVKMAPEFTSLTGTKTGNSSVRVDWTGNYMDGAIVNLYLLEEGSTEAGRLLRSGINAMAGTYTLELPEDVQTGNYVVRAELSKGDYGFTSKNAGMFTVTDLKAPEEPGSFKVSPAGNGYLRAEWTAAGGKYPAQGYILQILNEDGTPVSGLAEAYVSGRTEAVLGGEVTQQDGTMAKLEPGRKYKVSIMSHREDELAEGEFIQKQHYSGRIISEPVYVPVPKPPMLRLVMKTGEGVLSYNTRESSIDEYYSMGKEAELCLETDTPSSATVYLNDAAVYSGGAAEGHKCLLTLNEGENKVSIRAANSAGDFTDKTIRVIADTLPPLLLIDSTEVKEENGTAIAILRGKCEPGSRLVINGGDAVMDKNGLFEYRLFMGNGMSVDVYASAEDTVGNVTEYRSNIYNNTLNAIQKTVITPTKPTLEVGESLRLELKAVDSEGRYLSVKPELVKWTLMTDTGSVSLDSSANVTALKPGKEFIMAEYKVTDGYSHTDAMPMTIVEGTGTRSKAADYKHTGPADILADIIKLEKDKTDIYSGRMLPGKETTLNADKELSVFIPAGAMSDNADIRISRYDGEPELMKKFPGMKLLSPIFDISLNKDMKLGAPISITLGYDAGQAADTARIAVYRLDEQLGEWDYIGGRADNDRKTVMVELSSFSKYAVLENSALQLMNDIDSTRWSRDVVYSLVHRKIAEGSKNGSEYYFMPDNYITRAEFIKLLSAGVGIIDAEEAGTQLPFKDKRKIPAWALKHVRTAYANGWIKGRLKDGQRFFGANEPITREEACTVLGRMLGDTERPKGIYFTDRDQVAAYAIDYIDILADMGVLKGYYDNTFRPKNLITREEAAAIISKYLKYR